MRDPKRILITGASSGIGAALARAYAAPGVSLALGGRDTARLEAVAADCRAAGAEVRPRPVDVADRAAMTAWIATEEQAGPLDLVIANAGIDGSRLAGDERYYGVFEVNVGGVLNTVLPALSAMAARRRGQIALVSSLAGLRGMPGSVAYSASKAAVRSLGEGLRGRYRGQGVAVNVICPGFVESRITADNRFPMPFLWPADKAAQRIKAGLARDQGRIAFPWPMYAAAWLLNLLPQPLCDRLLARTPRKA
jgi:short-subunit dehydrogenase